VVEVIRCVLLGILEAVEGELCLLEVMCLALLCMLEGVEVMRRLFCTPDASEVPELLEALEVLEALEMPEVLGGDAPCAAQYAGGRECKLCLLDVLDMMRCVLFCTLEAVEGEVCLLEVLGGDSPCVARMLEAVEGSSVCWR